MQYPGEEDYIDAYTSFYDQFLDKEEVINKEGEPKLIKN